MKYLQRIMTTAGAVLVVASSCVLYATTRSIGGVPVASAVQTVSRTPQVTTPEVVRGTPVKLSVPSLDMSLDVVPGTYDATTKQWTLTTDKVQYATITPQANTASGNTFIYGHYRKNVFASLHTIQPGAVVVISTDNGHVFYYEFASSEVVDPTQTDKVFADSARPVLTLQTCTGPLFQNRQLFTFNLMRAV